MPSSRLVFFAGPHLVCHWSPESGVDCPCPWFHANSLLLASLLSNANCSRPGPPSTASLLSNANCSPLANCLSALLSSQLSFASPYHFRIRRDFRSKNPLSGFAPKQTKESSALAGYPYSATAVNHLKKARGEIWPKRSERTNNTKTTKMRTKSPQ